MFMNTIKAVMTTVEERANDQCISRIEDFE